MLSLPWPSFPPVAHKAAEEAEEAEAAPRAIMSQVRDGLEKGLSPAQARSSQVQGPPGLLKAALSADSLPGAAGKVPGTVGQASGLRLRAASVLHAAQTR